MAKLDSVNLKKSSSMLVFHRERDSLFFHFLALFHTLPIITIITNVSLYIFWFISSNISRRQFHHLHSHINILQTLFFFTLFMIHKSSNDFHLFVNLSR